MSTQPVSKYLTSAHLCERFNCSTRTLHRWQLKKVNPMPSPRIRPSGTCNLWAKEDIDAWESALMKSLHPEPETENTH